MRSQQLHENVTNVTLGNRTGQVKDVVGILVAIQSPPASAHGCIVLRARSSDTDVFCIARSRSIDTQLASSDIGLLVTLDFDGWEDESKGESRCVVQKRPAEALGLGIGPFGHAEGVNDYGGTVIGEFAATRYELGVLARHYQSKLHEVYWHWEHYGCVGSSELRFEPFASRRLDTIWALLGDDEFQQAVARVNER